MGAPSAPGSSRRSVDQPYGGRHAGLATGALRAVSARPSCQRSFRLLRRHWRFSGKLGVAPAGAHEATKPRRTPAPHRLSPHRLNGPPGLPAARIWAVRGFESAPDCQIESAQTHTTIARAIWLRFDAAGWRNRRLVGRLSRHGLKRPPNGRGSRPLRRTEIAPTSGIAASMDGAADPPIPPPVARVR
jgi:hypothetical protein